MTKCDLSFALKPVMKHGFISMIQNRNKSLSNGQEGVKPPRKFKVQKVATKLMVSIFWDSAKTILVNYLPIGRTMNEQYYAGFSSDSNKP